MVEGAAPGMSGALGCREREDLSKNFPTSLYLRAITVCLFKGLEECDKLPLYTHQKLKHLKK